LIFGILLEVVKVVLAEFHQAKCSSKRVIVILTEKKRNIEQISDDVENNTALASVVSKNDKRLTTTLIHLSYYGNGRLISR